MRAVSLAANIGSKKKKKRREKKKNFDIHFAHFSIFSHSALHFYTPQHRHHRPPRSTDVYVGALRCDVIDYYSDDTKLVCRTRQLHWASAKDLEIKVALWSYTATSYATCADPDGCLFHYDGGLNTPMVVGADATVTPGGTLAFQGYLRGPEAVQYKITIDGKDCELRDIYQYSYTDDEGAPAGRGTRSEGDSDVGSMSKQEQLESLFGAPMADNSVPDEAYDASKGSADVEERKVLGRYQDYVNEWYVFRIYTAGGLNFQKNEHGNLFRKLRTGGVVCVCVCWGGP